MDIMVVPYKPIVIVSVLLLIISIGFGWIGFPLIFKRLIQKKISLTPESQTRGLWQAFPFPFDFGIHVFNVTNAVEIQNGGKPILQDVGPFIFDEFKDKYDFEDNDNDDSVSFNMRNTFIFRPDRSNGLTGEELITMPHPLIQIMAISVKRANPDVIQAIAGGLQIIFNGASPFITAPFLDIFFRGFFVDCSSEHPAAKAVCGQFESGNVKGATKFNETHFKFSLMGGGNHTDAGRFTVLRGQRNTKDIGKVLQFYGKSELNTWTEGNCNKFKGTDGTIFPPFMNPNDGLWSYSADLCRSMVLQLRRTSHYAGLPTLHFAMDFGDIQNEPENICFCRSYPDVCPAKGTMDLSPCTGTPMIASMPHFLRGETSLLQNVDGLYPSEIEHGTHLDFEVVSGTPVSVYKRIQFNLDVEPVAEVNGMGNFRKLVMPLFWIDESLNLIPAVTDELAKIFKMLLIKDIVKWSTLVASIIGFAAAIYFHSQQSAQHPIVPIQ